MDVGLHGWVSTPRYSRSLYQGTLFMRELLHFKVNFFLFARETEDRLIDFHLFVFLACFAKYTNQGEIFVIR